MFYRRLPPHVKKLMPSDAWLWAGMAAAAIAIFVSQWLDWNADVSIASIISLLSIGAGLRSIMVLRALVVLPDTDKDGNRVKALETITVIVCAVSVGASIPLILG